MVVGADDFVILARYQGSRLIEWVERTLQACFKLTINRDKTRVVNLNEPSASVSFLGFTFRYDRDLKGRAHRYPSAAFADVNWYVTESLTRHLQHRSQRPLRPSAGQSFYGQLQRLGQRLL